MYLVFWLLVILIVLFILRRVIKFIAKALDTPEKQAERERRRKEEEERRKEEEAQRRLEEARQEREMTRWRLEELERSVSSAVGSEVARWLDKELLRVPYMDGWEFERFCADLFRSLGYAVAPVGGPGDQGADLLLRSDAEKIAVQCKNYAKPVGNRPVQEVFAGAKYHGASGAWVVAPNGYTLGAIDAARHLEVDLLDRSGIQRLIEQIRSAAPANGKQGIPDQPLFELLLEQYQEYVNLMELANEERVRGEEDPEVERQFESTEKVIYTNMGEVLTKLDTLERRNPNMPKVNSAERQSWQAKIDENVRKIEKATQKKPRRLRQFDG